MQKITSRGLLLALCIVPFVLTSCASMSQRTRPAASASHAAVERPLPNYASRLPQKINTREKVIVINPNVHAWGAYDSNGNLVRAGLATAGASWCSDIKRACKTRAGSFRIQSLGARSCKSSIYPLPKGGAPMPYCMFFNGNQGLHGSPYVMEGNASHGCVRMRVEDAEWMRFNFARIGTKVIVKSY